jgi:tetratricopeptide (TPR) repeat protein
MWALLSAAPSAVLPGACAVASSATEPSVAGSTGPRASALSEVDAAIAQQRWRRALATVEEALIATPEDGDWIDRQVALLRLLGREPSAAAVVARRLLAAPDDARLHYEAGELAAHLGDSAAARHHFEAAARLAPDDPRPPIALAAQDLAARPPRLDAAAARLAPLLRMSPATSSVIAKVADGRATEAAPTAESLAAAWFHQGLIEEARGDAACALVAFARAIELDPRHAAAWCNAAALHEERGDLATALALLDRAAAAAASAGATDLPVRAAIERERRRLAAR